MFVDARARPADDRYLQWIAGYTLVKGLLLLVLALGFLHFVHKDVDVIAERWIAALRFDLDNRYVAALLRKLDLVTDRQLKQLSGLTFGFSTVFLIEGVGLFLRQRWAEFLTVIVTAALVPLEVFETIRHFSLPKVLLIMGNLAIVWMLISVLRREKKQSA